jgi:hypothetical protein
VSEFWPLDSHIVGKSSPQPPPPASGRAVETDTVTLERAVLAPVLSLLKIIASRSWHGEQRHDIPIDAKDHFLRLSSAIARSDAERELNDAAKVTSIEGANS